MHEIYGERAAWVEYIRPGFMLSQQIGTAVRNNPKFECIVMGKHGLVTWGETSSESYENTLRIIGEAEAYLEKHRDIRSQLVKALPEVERTAIVAKPLPVLRGACSGQRSSVLLYDDSPEVLEFVGQTGARELSRGGAACPDHLVHTKRVPLFIDTIPGCVSGSESSMSFGLA
jgi:rhamnose utilization protein RhaD (predicted bifunctional aldolase and dehydrogenase)